MHEDLLSISILTRRLRDSSSPPRRRQPCNVYLVTYSLDLTIVRSLKYYTSRSRQGKNDFLFVDVLIAQELHETARRVFFRGCLGFLNRLSGFASRINDTMIRCKWKTALFRLTPAEHLARCGSACQTARRRHSRSWIVRQQSNIDSDCFFREVYYQLPWVVTNSPSRRFRFIIDRDSIHWMIDRTRSIFDSVDEKEDGHESFFWVRSTRLTFAWVDTMDVLWWRDMSGVRPDQWNLLLWSISRDFQEWELLEYAHYYSSETSMR